jgi:hypothetical protein
MVVIPAKAGIHVAPVQKAKMDSRFRGNDGHWVIGGFRPMLVEKNLMRSPPP